MNMTTRPIPSTREALPVIGCGTWIGFDVSPGSAEYQRLPGVLDALFAAGGTLIDSSPMYGRAEAVVGALLAPGGQREKAFLATKVWTSGREAGIAQMEQSFQRLRTERIDLLQVHNLVDWRTHLATLRDWKAQGRVRYIGITHYTASAYAEVEAVLRAEPLDFLQINYSIDARQGRGAPAAAGSRARRGGERQHALRRRRAAAPAARQAPARLGGRDRLRELGAAAAEVRAEPPGRDLHHPGHQPCRAHGGQRGGGGNGQLSGCGLLAPAGGFAAALGPVNARGRETEAKPNTGLHGA